MAPKQPDTGLFVGLNKGHIVTKKELPAKPSDREGESNSRGCWFCTLREKNYGASKSWKGKRALKVAKRKLGTHKRPKKKREEMSNVLQKMRSGGGGEKKK